MTEIAFDEFKIKSRSILGQSESPAMIRSLIRHGIVKSEKQAISLMVLSSVLFLALSVYTVYINFFKVPEIPPVSDEDQAYYSQQINPVKN